VHSNWLAAGCVVPGEEDSGLLPRHQRPAPACGHRAQQRRRGLWSSTRRPRSGLRSAGRGRHGFRSRPTTAQRRPGQRARRNQGQRKLAVGSHTRADRPTTTTKADVTARHTSTSSRPSRTPGVLAGVVMRFGQLVDGQMSLAAVSAPAVLATLLLSPAPSRSPPSAVPSGGSTPPWSGETSRPDEREVASTGPPRGSGQGSGRAPTETVLEPGLSEDRLEEPCGRKHELTTPTPPARRLATSMVLLLRRSCVTLMRRTTAPTLHRGL
jgi:hypothetical protein